ncbi:dCTP deaminase domain-containing protein [Sphingobacterium siyangense]|uniref:dCTP deaminase domain-containing protein n=1 Tax=Sphingobacterium siyangense TaxID=459529 RepID=UPI003018C5A6
MPFLGPSELKKILSTKLIVTDGEGNNVYNKDRVEEAAYALSLGKEAYRTDNKDRKIEILDDKSRTIEINPGQFTLLMTKEYLFVPKDKLAFISIKAKQKLKGLINVSGFHVDPGFEGKLLFSVYNAGPSTITLEIDKPYFLIWFADLDSEAKNGDEYNDVKNHHQGQKNIPLEYVDALKRGELTSPNELLKKINENKTTLDRIIWIGGIIIALAITITSKTFYDWNSFKSGYEYGMREKELDVKIKDIISTNLEDSLYLRKLEGKKDIRLQQSHVKK